jgi:hypothetical protein
MKTLDWSHVQELVHAREIRDTTGVYRKPRTQCFVPSSKIVYLKDFLVKKEGT